MPFSLLLQADRAGSKRMGDDDTLWKSFSSQPRETVLSLVTGLANGSTKHRPLLPIDKVTLIMKDAKYFSSFSLPQLVLFRYEGHVDTRTTAGHVTYAQQVFTNVQAFDQNDPSLIKASVELHPELAW